MVEYEVELPPFVTVRENPEVASSASSCDGLTKPEIWSSDLDPVRLIALVEELKVL